MEIGEYIFDRPYMKSGNLTSEASYVKTKFSDTPLDGCFLDKKAFNSYIEEALSDSFNIGADLWELIKILELKLEGVLKPISEVDAQCAEKVNPAPITSKLAERIKIDNCSKRSANSALSEIIKRIDL